MQPKHAKNGTCKNWNMQKSAELWQANCKTLRGEIKVPELWQATGHRNEINARAVVGYRQS